MIEETNKIRMNYLNSLADYQSHLINDEQFFQAKEDYFHSLEKLIYGDSINANK